MVEYGPAPAPMQSVEDVGVVAAKYGIMAVLGPILLMVVVNFVRTKVFRGQNQAHEAEATRVNVELAELQRSKKDPQHPSGPDSGRIELNGENVRRGTGRRQRRGERRRSESFSAGSSASSSPSSSSLSSVDSEQLASASALLDGGPELSLGQGSDSDSSSDLPEPPTFGDAGR